MTVAITQEIKGGLGLQRNGTDMGWSSDVTEANPWFCHRENGGPRAGEAVKSLCKSWDLPIRSKTR